MLQHQPMLGCRPSPLLAHPFVSPPPLQVLAPLAHALQHPRVRRYFFPYQATERALLHACEMGYPACVRELLRLGLVRPTSRPARRALSFAQHHCCQPRSTFADSDAIAGALEAHGVQPVPPVPTLSGVVPAHVCVAVAACSIVVLGVWASRK
jgi:hypothetical protein